MLNQQPISKVVTARYVGELLVHSIFETIQGEGPFAGTPCMFIRLAGCNLQCPLCDTEYTHGAISITPGDIASELKKHRGSGLVVITGGEPFRQNLTELLHILVDEGYYVQIETNGTLPPPQLDFSYRTHLSTPLTGVYIVCSPKTGFVNQEIPPRAIAYKYVMSHGSIDSSDGLPVLALGHTANPRLARPPLWWDRAIYLQPADHQHDLENELNRLVVVKSCMKYGYILQLQIHKILNLA